MLYAASCAFNAARELGGHHRRVAVTDRWEELCALRTYAAEAMTTASNAQVASTERIERP
jgi:hypothetical protein